MSNINLLNDQNKVKSWISVSKELNANDVKSVKTELETKSGTYTHNIEETIPFRFGIQYYNNGEYIDVTDGSNVCYITTNELFSIPTINDFQYVENSFFGIYCANDGSQQEFGVAYNYVEGSDDINFLLPMSELPSIAQSKDFYINYTNNSPYTNRDMKFVITNVDGTNYTFSFLYEKTEEITTTKKEIKSTTTRNNDNEDVENNVLSGLLQTVDVKFEERVGEVALQWNNLFTKIYIYDNGNNGEVS